jgi:alginate O-acetyltransferase complex protein AlgI
VIWGAYHGVFLILDRIFLARFLEKIGKFPSVMITFFIVMIGWVIFRLENFPDILTYLSKLFDFSVISIPKTIPSFYVILFIAIIFSFITFFSIGKMAEKFIYQKESYQIKQHIIFCSIAILMFVLSISSITSSGFNPFIYFRF